MAGGPGRRKAKQRRFGGLQQSKRQSWEEKSVRAVSRAEYFAESGLVSSWCNLIYSLFSTTSCIPAHENINLPEAVFWKSI